MESLIEEATADREQAAYEDLDMYGRNHADLIERQADRVDETDE